MNNYVKSPTSDGQIMEREYFMRKIVKMISILVVVLVLAGCGKRKLSLEEIKLDVEKFSDIPMEGNEITKFEIIKRQTNIKEKKDTVYVHIEAENEDFFC